MLAWMNGMVYRGLDFLCARFIGDKIVVWRGPQRASFDGTTPHNNGPKVFDGTKCAPYREYEHVAALPGDPAIKEFIQKHPYPKGR